MIEPELAPGGVAASESSGPRGSLPVFGLARRMPLVKDQGAVNRDDRSSPGAVETAPKIIVLLPVALVELVEAVDRPERADPHTEVAGRQFGLVLLSEQVQHAQTAQDQVAGVPGPAPVKRLEEKIVDSSGPFTAFECILIKRIGLFRGERYPVSEDHVADARELLDLGQSVGRRATVAVVEDQHVGVRGPGVLKGHPRAVVPDLGTPAYTLVRTRDQPQDGLGLRGQAFDDRSDGVIIAINRDRDGVSGTGLPENPEQRSPQVAWCMGRDHNVQPWNARVLRVEWQHVRYCMD